ncbi:hypothetical protein DFJ74DRAFT_754741 [Hyaloraphidium curvatum]|nr:hypothetical protein DFJ74DRAFT_754741 [Hyaloraphidium curvatum]
MPAAGSLRALVLFALAFLALLAVACADPDDDRNKDDKNEKKDRCSCEARKEVVKKVYYHVYTDPTGVILGTVNIDDVWAPFARARINPLGSFPSRAGVLEYYYGLASGSNFQSADYVKLVCDCNGIIGAHVNIVQQTATGPRNYTHFGFFTFSDTNNTIVSADVTFTNLGFGIDPKSPAARAAQINRVCGLTVFGPGGGRPGTCEAYQNLTGWVGSTPVERFADCVAFMNSIPYGSFDRANSNTATCRALHALMTPYSPEVHCLHVGKTGGPKCIDFTYDSYYQESY